MTTTAPTDTATWSAKNKVGLGLAMAHALTNLPSAILPAPEGAEVGPLMAILVVCSVLAAVALVAGDMAWRTGSRPVVRLTAASLIIITLTSLPAFFVDVPAAIKILVAAGVVLTVVFTVLIFSPSKRR
jgi:hypothetical protein